MLASGLSREAAAIAYSTCSGEDASSNSVRSLASSKLDRSLVAAKSIRLDYRVQNDTLHDLAKTSGAVAQRIFAALCAHYPKLYVALIESKAVAST